MTRAVPLCAIVVGLSFASGLTMPVAGQVAAVSMLVLDDRTDWPVPAVRVAIPGERAERATDDAGRLLYAVSKPGKVAFVLTRLGYMPGAVAIDVAANDTARITFVMTPLAQTLATVTISDTMASVSPFLAGFERRLRAHAGSAVFITRSEIDRRKPVEVSDLFQRLPSVTVHGSTIVSRRIQRPVIRGSGGNFFLDLANCPLRVAVDGQLMSAGYSVNDLVGEEIHGIEVYPGPSTIPAQYASMQRDAPCGLIAVWTRRDR